MNKPAQKEPSMDEILSSIRQIIADDDATVPRRAAPPAAAPPPPPAEEEPEPAALAPEAADDDDAEPIDEPLALSPEQIVPPDEAALAGFNLSPLAEIEFPPLEGLMAPTQAENDALALLVDPEDIAFEPERESEPFIEEEPPAPPVFAPPAPRAAPPPPALRAPARQTAAQAAPMPDPSLSDDIAEQLLEPATQAAARANFARLGAIGNPSLTIEAMMRDMLKPMLKEWLDENLPAVVERMVEKEIARISRGVE